MRLHTTFNVLALAVVDSRTLAGVLGWTHRNYLHQPALCGDRWVADRWFGSSREPSHTAWL